MNRERDTNVENIADSEGKQHAKTKRKDEIDKSSEARKKMDDDTDLAGQRQYKLKLGGGSP